MSNTQVAVTANTMLDTYATAFTNALPEHVPGRQWLVKIDNFLRSNPKVAAAANNDLNAFMGAVLNAARLGLEPGTEQYYLVPFKDKGVEKVQGIPGYQGLLELIYRAGAVASVKVEPVYEKDHFAFSPGTDDRPIHEVDWFGGDRGKLIGAYAYAEMKDGATSKVVVVTPEMAAAAKKVSRGSDSNYSPWQTNPAAMYMKTAVRQLVKWVPTSSEYRRTQLRDAQKVASEFRSDRAEQVPMEQPAEGQYVDDVTGEIYEAEELPGEES